MRALAALFALPLLSAASPGNAPSFSCSGNLSLSERAICDEPELSAWDRAIALLYPVGRKSEILTISQQREWLASRNKCGADKACLRQSFQIWPGYPGVGFGVGQRFVRPSKTDDANMTILPIGAGWYSFSIQAIHIVTDKRGRFLTANEGGTEGVVLIAGGKGHFSTEPGDEFSCEIDFIRSRNGWLLKDNGQCGGLNVTLTGNYRPFRAGQRI